MRSNIKIALVLLSLSFSAQAQVSDFEVEWGEKIAVKKMVVADILYAGNQTEFYAVNQSLRVFKGQTFLEKYNGLQKTVSKEIGNEYERGGDFSAYRISELKGNLYALKSIGTKESVSLSVQGIDQKTLEFSGTEDMIYNFKLSKGRKNTLGEYTKAVSFDENRVAYIIEHPGDVESKAIYTVKVFDHNYELLWKTKYTQSYERGLSSIESVNVSDDGKVYMLTKVRKDRKESERGERNYEYFINVVSENGLETKEKLQLKDNFILDLELNIANNGGLMCGGFYSKEGYRSDGVFFMQLDSKDFSVKSESLKEFELDFITDGMTKVSKAITKNRSKKGKEVGLTNVEFRNFIVKEDGGAILVGEYVNIYTTYTTNGDGTTSSTTYYNYDDIYVISINDDGGIEWAKKIRKKQQSTNDNGRFSSFFLVVNHNKLHFIFNDNKENEGVQNAQDILKYNLRIKGSVLMAVSIDSEGKYSREALVVPEKGEKMRLRPKSCEQISDDEFILFSVSKKYNKFARVKVK